MASEGRPLTFERGSCQTGLVLTLKSTAKRLRQRGFTSARVTAVCAAGLVMAMAGPARGRPPSATPTASAVSDKPTKPTKVTEVVPGGLVRWEGETTDACVFGDERFSPVWKSCFFAVDLFTPPGTIEVGRERAGVVERRNVRVLAYPYPTQHVTIEDQGKVDLSKADAARAEREQTRMTAALSGRTARRFSLPLLGPLASLPTGGRFGARRMFNGQPRSPHTGVDFATAAGTRVLAVADGTVRLAEEHFFPGKAVVIDHGDGLFTMSFHLRIISVKEGQEIQRGAVIGEVGATGRASGPHLHFAARWRGARIDPELLLGRTKPAEL